MDTIYDPTTRGQKIRHNLIYTNNHGATGTVLYTLRQGIFDPFGTITYSTEAPKVVKLKEFSFSMDIVDDGGQGYVVISVSKGMNDNGFVRTQPLDIIAFAFDGLNMPTTLVRLPLECAATTIDKGEAIVLTITIQQGSYSGAAITVWNRVVMNWISETQY